MHPVERRLRYRAHVTADHTPRTAGFARPDARISERSSIQRARDFDREPRAKAGHGDVWTDASHSKLLGLVLSKANNARSMRLEILTLGRELAVRTGEEEILRDQRIELRHVGVELSEPKPRLDADDFRVGFTDEHGFERVYVSGHQSRPLNKCVELRQQHDTDLIVGGGVRDNRPARCP